MAKEETVRRRNIFSGEAPRIRHHSRPVVVPSSTIVDIVLRTTEGVLADLSYSRIQELAESAEQFKKSGANKPKRFRYRLFNRRPEHVLKCSDN
jgi:hypothetical protein